MTDTGTPRVAVIGSGYWGKNLVRNFNALGSLALICDRDEATLAAFAQEYPGLDTCMALSGVLSRDDVDAVAVATPAESHAHVVREALEAGKHVFVEKPLALSERDAEDLIALARERDRILMVGHLLQYHPVFKVLKRMVLSGELGRINYIYSNRLNLGKIRREENILWSFAPHDISMILSLTGEEPIAVSATGGNYLHAHIADVTTTHLEFASGLKAHVFVSWLHPFKEQKLVVVGDRKMAVFDDTQPWADKLLLYPHEIRWQGDVPVAARAEAERPEVPEDEPLRNECRHFLNCVAGGTRPLTDGIEGLKVLKVLNAAQRSMDAGCGRITPGASAPPAQGRDYFVHETAVVDDDVVIGKGTRVWHFSHLMPGTRIGGNCVLGQNVTVGPEVTVGHGCKIQNNVSVYKGVTLEDDVFCGPSMVFTNVFNPRCHIPRMDELRPTLVRKGATLGANCTIVCGNTVGRYALIGAGAVVTRDVPDHALMTGNPARRTGWVCECGGKLGEEHVCEACGRGYTESGPAGLKPLTN